MRGVVYLTFSVASAGIERHTLGRRGEGEVGKEAASLSLPLSPPPSLSSSLILSLFLSLSRSEEGRAFFARGVSFFCFGGDSEASLSLFIYIERSIYVSLPRSRSRPLPSSCPCLGFRLVFHSRAFVFAPTRVCRVALVCSRARTAVPFPSLSLSLPSSLSLPLFLCLPLSSSCPLSCGCPLS